MSKPTVLLDIDNTILDVESFKKKISVVIDDNYGEKANEKFWEIYDQVRQELGFVKVKEIAMRFAKALNSPDYASALAAFLEVPFEKCLIPGAEELIDLLSKNANVVVFTHGDELFQNAKINKLGLDNIAVEVIISPAKKDLFLEIANKYYGTIVVIDDNPEVLKKAIEDMPNCKTVWVKFGKYAERVETVGADFESENLGKIGDYIKNLQS